MSEENRPHTVTVEKVTRYELASMIEKVDDLLEFTNSPNIQKYLKDRRAYLQGLMIGLDLRIKADVEANMKGKQDV